MILGINLFRSNPEDARSGNYVPVAFPLIAGSGTLTTILSLRSVYNSWEILTGILINLVIVYLVLRASDWIEEKLGNTALAAIKKIFGVLLLAIAIRIFRTYIKFWPLTPLKGNSLAQQPKNPCSLISDFLESINGIQLARDFPFRGDYILKRP